MISSTHRASTSVSARNRTLNTATPSEMLRYMLDTNLCIRVLRDRPRGLRERFNAEADALCISTITLAELLHDAEKSARPVENRHEVGRFASRLDVLSFDDAAAAHSAEIRATLERRGYPIGGYDLLIAGHARSRGLVVVTGNLGEFSRVDGLRAEDWLPAADANPSAQ
jgi:tRNA(fMet)-specific endonuclease VapC